MTTAPLRVAHLLDDMQLGGVTRLVAFLIEGLGACRHERFAVVASGRFGVDASLRAFNPAVLVVHFTLNWGKLPYVIALRRAFPRARIILIEHSYTDGFERFCVAAPHRFRAMLRIGYRLVDRVIAVSRGQAEWFAAHRLVAAHKVTVIPVPVALDAFLALPLPAVRPGPMRLGAFGRFHRQKGFDVLIAAMALVDPADAVLVLAGFGPDEDALAAVAARVPHVELRGLVTDPAAFLGEVDALAMPSRWEPGAVSCWEARAAGRPLIVSRIDGLPEQVPPEVGLQVEPSDVPGLARAITTLAHAPRDAMARAARRSAEGGDSATLALWYAVLGDRANHPGADISRKCA